MKAALLRSYGGVDQFAIEEVPTPKPRPGEVLIKIAASAVNPFDLILRQGFMAQYIPLPMPAILGGDAAGRRSRADSGAMGAVGRAAIQYLRQLGARPVAGVRDERLAEARELAGEALDITVPPAMPTFDFAISAAPPVAGHLIALVRDGGQVASIVPVPEGANADDRVTIHELYHRTDAATLDAAARGQLVIPIARTFALEQIREAHNEVAGAAHGKVVLRH